MKYYISHVQNTTEHQSQFPLDIDGNPIQPYLLVAERAYVMNVGTPIEIEDCDGATYTPKTRSTTNLQSVALICTPDDFIPLNGQTLYDVSDLETVKTNHPDLDYSLLGQAWVNGVLIP